MKLREAIAIAIDRPATLQADTSGLWLQLLGDLKALSDSYQSTHWRALGDAYYGDHQLYQRLYDDISSEIDTVAERALGITGNDTIVEPANLMSVSAQSLKTLVVPGEFASMMLNAERQFLLRLNYVIDNLEHAGQLTDGVANMLQGVADKHEEHVYLLSRRVRRE